jgi:N-methylhydantoinase A
MGRTRVAVDIGGTFTDICILDEASGRIRVAKVPSTPDPIDGALEGCAGAGVDLGEVTLFSHGTTVATNALIMRKLPKTAMVCTRGFRDVIEIGNSTKENLWDAYVDNPPPYLRRRDRLPVTERIDASGRVVTPLDEAEVRELARVIRKRGYVSVAVCFMNAYASGAHEKRCKALLEAELPGVSISTSSEVLAEIFEHDRFSTAVVNAVLHPVVGDYALNMQQRLRERGYANDLLLLHSGGGVMTPKTVHHQAARLASSGIAAGAIASRYIGTLCGFPNSLGLDMGGTSCDISLVADGEPVYTREWFIEYGHPICFPSIDVKTIGAGGGSLAWIDEAGSLRNGPDSAGSVPGPACYGRGGERPTNTDANLVLGRLGGGLVGGGLTLDVALARTAIEEYVAGPMGMDLVTAAKAIIEVANANMADALRRVSIMRGHDPRDFALIAFGGAGALHGAALARELAIPTVIVPPHPGVTSAMGCLLVDIQHDLGQTFLAAAAEADPAAIEADFLRLEDEARERLAKEGVAPAQMLLKRSLDMRYQGQWRSIAVPVGHGVTDVAPAMAAFQDAHQREYGYRREAAIEIFRLNLTAIGLTPKAELARHAIAAHAFAPKTTREVWFDESDSALATPVYWRDDLPAGATFEGPAIVDQFDSTTVVPPGARCTVDEWLNLRIEVKGAP